MSTAATIENPAIRIRTRADFDQAFRSLASTAAAGPAPPSGVGSGLARLLAYRLACGTSVGGGAGTVERCHSVDDFYELHTVITTEGALGGDAASPVSPDPLTGEFTALRAVTASHLDWVSALLTHPALIEGPPLWGRTPPPGAVADLVAAQVLCQFLVCAADGLPRALVRAVDADLQNRHAHVQALVPPAALADAWPLEGLAVFVGYCFDAFALRKLYVEIPETVHRQLPAAVHELVTVEGVLRAHRLVRGRWIDVVHGAIWVDAWTRARHRWLPVAGVPCPQPGTVSASSRPSGPSTTTTSVSAHGPVSRI